MDNQSKVSLGCGTLILIALIVIIFGNMGGRDATQQVNNLEQQVVKLSQAVEKLQAQLDDQSKKLEVILSAVTKPGPK